MGYLNKMTNRYVMPTCEDCGKKLTDRDVRLKKDYTKCKECRKKAKSFNPNIPERRELE